jgi:hypothetical protein
VGPNTCGLRPFCWLDCVTSYNNVRISPVYSPLSLIQHPQKDAHLNASHMIGNGRCCLPTFDCISKEEESVASFTILPSCPRVILEMVSKGRKQQGCTYLTQGAAYERISGREPRIPIDVMFVEPFDCRPCIFYNSIPLRNVETKVNVWRTDKADPHKDAPKYHANA